MLHVAHGVAQAQGDTVLDAVAEVIGQRAVREAHVAASQVHAAQPRVAQLGVGYVGAAVGHLEHVARGVGEFAPNYPHLVTRHVRRIAPDGIESAVDVCMEQLVAIAPGRERHSSPLSRHAVVGQVGEQAVGPVAAQHDLASGFARHDETAAHNHPRLVMEIERRACLARQRRTLGHDKAVVDDNGTVRCECRVAAHHRRVQRGGIAAIGDELDILPRAVGDKH